MQYQLPLMCVLNGPQAVPAQVVNEWKSVHDAAVWAFENRDNKTAKTKVWIAQHMQMRTQHITRMLDRRLSDLRDMGCVIEPMKISQDGTHFNRYFATKVPKWLLDQVEGKEVSHA